MLDFKTLSRRSKFRIYVYGYLGPESEILWFFLVTISHEIWYIPVLVFSYIVIKYKYKLFSLANKNKTSLIPKLHISFYNDNEKVMEKGKAKQKS